MLKQMAFIQTAMADVTATLVLFNASGRSRLIASLPIGAYDRNVRTVADLRGQFGAIEGLPLRAEHYRLNADGAVHGASLEDMLVDRAHYLFVVRLDHQVSPSSTTTKRLVKPEPIRPSVSRRARGFGSFRGKTAAGKQVPTSREAFSNS